MIEPTAVGAPVLAETHGDLPSVPGYEVVAELGRGGMGVVYQALHLRTNLLVALKLIRDGALASPQDRARFRLEAESFARIRHPNVVEIIEVGEHQGRPYFAMEYVAGGSLDKRLAGRPMPIPLAAEWIRALADAVQHAHDQKIIHRDLKPANVLVDCAADGCIRRLKITDFGLAKRLDAESTAWTQDGAILGTASYMAPEQAAGRVREMGPAADVHALGAMLYELLTGRPPYRGESWHHTVDLVLHDEPALPTLLNAGVPRDLETICLKCLEKAPERRYASARELAADLERFLAGQLVVAEPQSAMERLRRLAARDGYQILAKVGEGPRSVVYQAVSEPVKQHVALKVFAPGMLTRDEWEEHARRAASLWAAVSDPRFVPIQRHGWWDAAPYLAMEYLPKGGLAASADSFRTGLDGVRQAIGLVKLLADAASYLHRQGVVHGNLKLSNVLLTAADEPRIVDFQPTAGLFVDRHAPWPPSDHRLTVQALAYLPPELISNPQNELRPYVDTFGLGAILYELLTGQAPFTAATVEEMLQQVREHEPIPPSRFNPHVWPHLERTCLKCLRKNPWQRYVRAFDLSKRLGYFLESPEPGSAAR